MMIGKKHSQILIKMIDRVFDQYHEIQGFNSKMVKIRKEESIYMHQAFFYFVLSLP